jgi:hypothetical protein
VLLAGGCVAAVVVALSSDVAAAGTTGRGDTAMTQPGGITAVTIDRVMADGPEQESIHLDPIDF